MNSNLIKDYFKSCHSLPIVWGHPLTCRAEIDVDLKVRKS